MHSSFHSLRVLALCLLAALAGLAFADDRFRLGLNAYPTAGAMGGLHAVAPLFEWRDVDHNARADLSYAAGGLPGMAVSYQMEGTPPDEDLERYLGAGVSVALADAPVASPLLGGHASAGLRVPVVSRLEAVGEVTVSGNAAGMGIGLGLGLEYAFGGTE